MSRAKEVTVQSEARGGGEGVSDSVGSQQFGIYWIPPHWQPLGLMSGPPKELPTCHPLQQHKGASCAIFLSSQEGFSALCSAWLPTQDATTVVICRSPQCLQVLTVGRGRTLMDQVLFSKCGRKWTCWPLQYLTWTQGLTFS